MGDIVYHAELDSWFGNVRYAISVTIRGAITRNFNEGVCYQAKTIYRSLSVLLALGLIGHECIRS